MNRATVASPVASGAGRWHRVGVVAREEFRQALESRWLFGFTALLAALVLGLSFFGMAQSREVGFQGFARVTLSLMNLVLFIVPLTGLMLGVTSVTGGSALTVAQLVGFGGGGVVVALSAGADQVRGFAALAGLSIALGWLMVSTSLMIAVLRPDRLKAMSTALFLWLLLVVAYDLVVLGATTILNGLPLQRVLVPALLLNPVDIARVLTTLAVGSGALFGPTSAVLMQLSGTAAGIGIGLLVLAVETIVPAAIAMWVFERRDG